MAEFAFPFPLRWFKLEQPYGPQGRVEDGSSVFEAFHTGDDFAVPDRTPLEADEGGIVQVNRDWTLPGHPRGWAVTVRHPEGTSSLYGHLSEIDVQQGQHVAAGQLLGLSGGAIGEPGAGFSTGPHLHFERRDAFGHLVDPHPYLESLHAAGVDYHPQGGAGPMTDQQAEQEAAQRILRDWNNASLGDAVTRPVSAIRDAALAVPKAIVGGIFSGIGALFETAFGDLGTFFKNQAVPLAVAAAVVLVVMGK